MGSSESTQHPIPRSTYEKASRHNFNYHEPTMTNKNVNTVNEFKPKTSSSVNEYSHCTHYPDVSKYSFTKEELGGMHTKNNYEFPRKNNFHNASAPKEELLKQVNLKQEKEYNNALKKTTETPSTLVKNNSPLESFCKPPENIKDLKEFMKIWNIWKEEMKSFLELKDYGRKDYNKWGAFLLNRMGTVGHEILQCLIFDNEDDKNNYLVLINKFNEYHMFFTSSKFPNESVINYVDRLEANSAKIMKNVDSMVKEKLEKEIESLCKEKFIAIATSKIPDFKFEKSFKSLTIKEITFLWDLCDKSIWKGNETCKYCGKMHPENKCFAFGKECNKCKRRNHFRKYCPGLMYVSNCSFCEGDHEIKKCLAYGEKCSKCNKVNHFSWICSKPVLTRNCKFCGLEHVLDRSKCPALRSLCSICKTTGHYDIKCGKNLKENSKN